MNKLLDQFEISLFISRILMRFLSVIKLSESNLRSSEC